MTTSISFYARGDGSSANNAALNVDSLSKQPVVLITFESSPGGDIVLERNGGAPDPDTTVLINGVRYNFTVELTGGLPISSGKVPDPLEGKTITVISTVINGATKRFFFVNDGSGSLSLMSQFGNGALALTNANFAPPPVYVCFCTGTNILTPSGHRKIETLVRGDLVITAQGLAKPILWIGQTDVSVDEMRSDPNRRPIRIRANSIEPGVPNLDIDVSAQHRIVFDNPHVGLLFGEDSVMVRAKHLMGSIAERLMPSSPVSYFHLLLEEHEVITANGLATESFQPSLRNYLGLPVKMKETFDLHMNQEPMHALFQRPDAMITLRSHEVQVLIAYLIGMRKEGVSEPFHFRLSESKIAA